jgi:hypothetical protein
MEQMEHPIVEYVKKGKKLPKFFSLLPEIQYDYFGEKFRKLPIEEREAILENIQVHPPQRTKVATMFAATLKNDPEQIVIGFSVCHSSLDIFDHTNQGVIKKVPGIGVNIAMSNALKWQFKRFVFPAVEPRQNLESCVNFHDYLLIPSTMMKYGNTIADFIGRANRYYKGKILPEWCHHLLQVISGNQNCTCDCCTEIKETVCK